MIYEVVGKRKEYYLKCEKEFRDRIKRVKNFIRKEFGIEINPKVQNLYIDLNEPFFSIKGKDKKLEEVENRLFERAIKSKDITLSVKNSSNGKVIILEVEPYRRTKSGKELYKKWEKVLKGDFGFLDLTEPFFLKLSSINIDEREKKKVKHPVYAKVQKDNGRLFLTFWKGFNPEELEGFKRIELKV